MVDLTGGIETSRVRQTSQVLKTCEVLEADISYISFMGFFEALDTSKELYDMITGHYSRKTIKNKLIR